MQNAGGYLFQHFGPCKDYSVNRPRQNMGYGAKTVLLLSDDLDIIQEFYSINEASRELGINVETIRKICMHKYKKPKFNFMYKSEYIEEQRLNVRESYEEVS